MVELCICRLVSVHGVFSHEQLAAPVPSAVIVPGEHQASACSCPCTLPKKRRLRLTYACLNVFQISNLTISGSRKAEFVSFGGVSLLDWE